MITEILYSQIGELMSTMGDITSTVITLAIFGFGLYGLGKLLSKLWKK